MGAEQDQRLLRTLCDGVSRAVASTPRERYGEELRIGADGTPTKYVDEVAEQEILRILREERAGLDLLSEEAGRVPMGGGRLLVADPIDGTTNASRGIPFFCVSLAIGRERLSDVECGIVVNLCTGDRFEAVKGHGATLNGRSLRVKANKDFLFSTGGIQPEDLPRGRGIPRSFGASALEMSLIASGAIDAYHYGKPMLRVIDIAASTLIVREAGGIVLDDKGHDLDLPLSLDPRFGLTAAVDRDTARRLGVIA